MKPTQATSNSPQKIEELQERYRQLHTRKIQSETNLANANERLEALKDEARKSYGTDDVSALRTKLDEMKAENEAKRSNYQAELDQIEAKLAIIEGRIAMTESPDAARAEQN